MMPDMFRQWPQERHLPRFCGGCQGNWLSFVGTVPWGHLIPICGHHIRSRHRLESWSDTFRVGKAGMLLVPALGGQHQSVTELEGQHGARVTQGLLAPPRGAPISRLGGLGDLYY